MIRTQNVMIFLPLPIPQEKEALGAHARRGAHIITEASGGAERRPQATAGAEPEAAVAAMEKVADQEEELPPREAEVSSLPNDDLGAVPNGALQGPPTRAHREERGRRDGRVTRVREEGARTTIEAGVATPHRADSLPLPLRRPVAVTKHTSAVANHEAAVAAMQGASDAEPLLLLVGEPAMPHHEAAVAAMKGAIPRQSLSIWPLRTLS